MADDVPAGYVVVELNHLPTLLENLNHVQTTLRGRETFIRIVANELLNAFDRALETKEDPATGESWSERRPVYVLDLLEHEKLFQTGLLKDIVQTFYDGTSGGIAINLEYARIHQLRGGDERLGDRARPFLVIDDYAEKRISEHFQRFCQGLLN